MTKLIFANDTAIMDGRSSLIHYQNYLACGASYRSADLALFRDTGSTMVVGAIHGCIERGLSTYDEIVAAVSKCTRCKHKTVSKILNELTGKVGQGYPFSSDGKFYRSNFIIKDFYNPT